jgi:hypothetical protein
VPEMPTPDEQFTETVTIGDDVVLRQEGTIHKLNALTSPLLAASPLPSSKADEVIKVLKFAWDIIKDSNATTATEGACTRILWAGDDDWVDYENAKDFASEEVKYTLDNFAGVNCYTVKFRVVGTYQARHPKIGGQWMPVIHVAFSRCDANWPWSIEGKATIDATNVSNMKTRDDPIPQIVLVTKITTSAKIGIKVESHERSFIFSINGRDGVKRL